ncbi:unnamed protein product, partial [Mesorhabditis belari]|uniref:Uncharacterized protein n=1 Tax=Mesorhabditis belari TaxID=2138241 RepID=A0AAF3FJ39_9BILA
MPTVLSKKECPEGTEPQKSDQNKVECTKDEVQAVEPGAVHGWLITDRDEQPIIGREKSTGDEVAQDSKGNFHNAKTGECVRKEDICSYD